MLASQSSRKTDRKHKIRDREREPHDAEEENLDEVLTEREIRENQTQYKVAHPGRTYPDERCPVAHFYTVAAREAPRREERKGADGHVPQRREIAELECDVEQR